MKYPGVISSKYSAFERQWHSIKATAYEKLTCDGGGPINISTLQKSCMFDLCSMFMMIKKALIIFY